MNDILQELTGGDLRSDGRADDVARIVINQPELLPDLIEGLASDNKIIRMRAAHAIEVISRENGGLLIEFKPRLIRCAKEDALPETRWHLAQVFGNIDLSKRELSIVVPILCGYLTSGTILVRSWAVVGLGNIAEKNAQFRHEVLQEVARLNDDESPAVRSRVSQTLEKLLK